MLDQSPLRYLIPMSVLAFVLYTAYQYVFPAEMAQMGQSGFEGIKVQNVRATMKEAPAEIDIPAEIYELPELDRPLEERFAAAKSTAEGAVDVMDGYTLDGEIGVWKDVLYLTKDFAAVELRLAELFAVRNEGRGGAAYRAMLDGLGELHPEMSELYTHWLVDEWKIALPNSQFACLVLADLHMEKAWQIRGGREPGSVSQNLTRKFEEEVARALAQLEDALARNDEDALPHVMLMEISMALGEGASTIEAHFQEAVARSPQFADAWLNRIEARLPGWGGSWDSVRACMVEAGKSAETHPQVGMAVAAGRRAMMREKLRGVDRSNPEQWAPISALYRAMLEAYPEDTEILHHYAYDALRFGPNALEAAKAFDALDGEYWNEGPWDSPRDYLDARINCYVACAGNPDPDVAFFYLRRAVDVAPDDFRVLFLQGLSNARREQYREAETALLGVLDRKPHHVPAMLELADVYLHMSRFDEAAAMADRVLSERSTRALKERAQGYIRDARNREHVH